MPLTDRRRIKLRMPLRTLAGVLWLAASFGAPAQASTVPDDATQVRPLAVGAAAPTVTVRNPDGSDRVIGPATVTRPTVLIFYRGGWCPYCNAHLGELKEAEGPLLELGFELLFLSADRPEALHSSLKEPDIRYTLLSDARMEAARAYGIAFRVDDATVARYQGFGIDLEAASGETHHELPVPAVFILDGDAAIRFVYANPDYKIRLKATDLLAAARRVLND